MAKEKSLEEKSTGNVGGILMTLLGPAEKYL